MKNQRQGKNMELIRQLRRQGIVVPAYEQFEDDDRSESIRISQVGGEIESSAADMMQSGGILYTIHVRLAFCVPTFAISSFDLEPLWEDPGIVWLEDPVETGAPFNEYRLPGDAAGFPRRAVINHFANVRRKFRRGESVQGLLLAYSLGAIPNHIRHGESVGARLTVNDQFDCAHSSPVFLWVNRGATMFHRPLKKTRRPLLASPDGAAYKDLEVTNTPHRRSIGSSRCVLLVETEQT